MAIIGSEISVTSACSFHFCTSRQRSRLGSFQPEAPPFPRPWGSSPRPPWCGCGSRFLEATGCRGARETSLGDSVECRDRNRLRIWKN